MVAGREIKKSCNKANRESLFEELCGDIFEVNYHVELMLESIKNIVEFEASSAANSTIPLKARSRILMKVIQYHHKHVQSSVSKDKTVESIGS
ncbi:hypothetical protein K1719_006054 [Acacia pycnantha]|nr:hypothetical protein K1719_006054 [Acacia pycnantha]